MPESKSGALPLGDSPAETSVGAAARGGLPRTYVFQRRPHLRKRHANAASGCRGSVRATRVANSRGTPASAACASASLANVANAPPPDPVIRADGDARFNTAIALATPGNFAEATDSRSLRP